LRKPIRLDEIVVAMARFKRNSYQQPRVLVIDDDRLALDQMRTTLENLSYDVRCEQDARRALSQLDQLQPDCIILDLIMPDFDGVATLAALQQMATWKHIPVLILTSMLLTDEEYAALTRSVATVINKRGDASAQMTLAPMIEQLRQRRHQTANTTDAAPATKGSA
jgi:CheY-like chemotaxis protein